MSKRARAKKIALVTAGSLILFSPALWFIGMLLKRLILWNAETRAYSSDLKYYSFQMRSCSSWGLAPHGGEHIAMVTRHAVFAEDTAPVVFAGYCENLRQRWTGPRELSIRCTLAEKGGIVKQLASFDDVTIKYDISSSTPAPKVGSCWLGDIRF